MSSISIIHAIIYAKAPDENNKLKYQIATIASADNYNLADVKLAVNAAHKGRTITYYKDLAALFAYLKTHGKSRSLELKDTVSLTLVNGALTQPTTNKVLVKDEEDTKDTDIVNPNALPPVAVKAIANLVEAANDLIEAPVPTGNTTKLEKVLLKHYNSTKSALKKAAKAATSFI